MLEFLKNKELSIASLRQMMTATLASIQHKGLDTVDELPVKRTDKTWIATEASARKTNQRLLVP